VSKGQENCVEFFMRAGLCFGPSNKGGFMKKFIFIYLIAFSLVSAFTLKTSYACDEHKKARYHDSEVNTKMEEKYDANHDGQISAGERRKMKAAMKKKHEDCDCCACKEKHEGKKHDCKGGTCPYHSNKDAKHDHKGH